MRFAVAKTSLIIEIHPTNVAWMAATSSRDMKVLGLTWSDHYFSKRGNPIQWTHKALHIQRRPFNMGHFPLISLEASFVSQLTQGDASLSCAQSLIPCKAIAYAAVFDTECNILVVFALILAFKTSTAECTE